MAEKSVFISKVEYPFFEEVHVNIDWFGAFARIRQSIRTTLTLSRRFRRQGFKY